MVFPAHRPECKSLSTGRLFSVCVRDRFYPRTLTEYFVLEDMGMRKMGVRLQTRLFVLGCVVLASQLAFGQTFGSIGGETRDSTGAIVAGATVTVVNTGTNATRTVATNDAGEYFFPSLPPGMYTVKAEKAGFKSVVRNQIELQVQLAARIDFELQVGQVSESVEVQADAALLVTDNATVGTVIENKRIVELPLNGRNYLQLVSLAPNVSTGFSGQGQAGARQGGIRAAQTISVAGQRTNFNHYTLDGVENTDPNFNTFVVMPSIDALQEFKVQTGVYPAEFGRQTTQINVLTKSGTNQYHGTLFEFSAQRQNGRQSLFVHIDTDHQRSLQVEPVRLHAGRADVAAENIQRQGQAVLHGELRGLPEARQHDGLYSWRPRRFQGGDFSTAANKRFSIRSRASGSPDGTITGDALRGKHYSGDPDQSDLEKAARSSTALRLCPASSIITSRRWRVRRIATNLSCAWTTWSRRNRPWAGRYSWGDENESSPGLNLNGTKLVTNLEQYMGTNTRVLSPTVVTETRFGYTRFYNSVGTLLAFQRNVVDELGIPGLKGGDPVSWGIPAIGIANYNGIGDSTDGPFENKNSTLQFLNNTSITRGKHSFRFGGEIRRDQFNQVGNQYGRGSFSFSRRKTRGAHAWHALPAGRCLCVVPARQRHPDRGCRSDRAVQFRATSFALYMDDVWKITPKLTLSLGLRYENTPPWEDISGNLVTVFFNAFDNTPNVTDQSRYPVFLRQGKGTGDPYAGLKVRWPNDPARPGRTPRQPPGESRQQRLRSAYRHRLEPELEVGGPHGSRHVLQPGPGQSAFRCRAERRRTHAQRRQSATSPPKPGSTGRPAWSARWPTSLRRKRSPTSSIAARLIRCSGCSTCSANSPTT